MTWFYLILAGLFECAWAIGLKYTEGFTKLVPSVITLILMFFSVLFLSFAIQKIPLSTGYAVWTGIGAVGTVIFGITMLGESASLIRLSLIAIIVVCIVGLELTSGH